MKLGIESPGPGEPLTYHEIAQRLGIAHETVRQHEIRALRKLRQLLAGRGWDAGALAGGER